jgi:hypothetical protein
MGQSSGQTIKCQYCGNVVELEPPPQAPQTTIIIEGRHRREHRHRLRKLIESLEETKKNQGD